MPVIELLPLTRITGDSWHQKLEQVVDVGDYAEAAIFTYAEDVNAGTGEIAVALGTAVENAEGNYHTLVRLGYFTGQLGGGTYRYLSGGFVDTQWGNGQPGFGRYLRVSVAAGDPAASLSLAVRGVFKR
jgi:hypothetical protein